MNNPIQTFQFNELPVSVIDHNGDGWMTGDDIGNALEYSSPRISINNIFDRNIDELDEYSVEIKLMSTDGKQYNTRVYNEEGVMMIAFFSKQPKAAAFRKWAVGVLKTYRNKELVKVDTAYIEEIKSHLESQKTLTLAQQDQVAYIRDQAGRMVASLQSQLQTAQQREKHLRLTIDSHRDELKRAVRAQRPIADAEKAEIAEQFESGWTIVVIAHRFFRSAGIVRRTLREKGLLA